MNDEWNKCDTTFTLQKIEKKLNVISFIHSNDDSAVV